ncbi:MAG: HIT family protein [Anaerolineae bacterium]|nr:HIT family protein [Anaerolineae bacterium]
MGTLAQFTEPQLKTFLSRVRTRNLLAYLRASPEADVTRLLGLLSPASAAFLRQRLAVAAPGGDVQPAADLLQSIAADDAPCLFCQILAGEAPASFIYRDEQVAVFMDLYPVTPGHLLIIPTQHAENFTDVPPDVAAHIMRVAQSLGGALAASDLGCDGYNLFLANGGAAGQDIFHVHLHILPRYHGDEFGFRFPPHYPQEADRALLDRQAVMLGDILTK